jgi:hypothetical protein
MSTLPLPEAIMLEIHQSLGGKPYQTKRKLKFAAAQDSLAAHETMAVEIMRSIFDALDMDDQARDSALGNFVEFANAYKTVELNTWTFNADQRQVLWMLLGYFFVPGLARYVAFWSLEEVLDKGMPGGRFWYLPEPCKSDDQPSLYLPVAQVVDWLLDLLGMPLEKLADEYSESTYGEEDGLRRSLYNWRKSTTLQLETINKYFSDDAVLDFKGVFLPNEDSAPAEQFSSALDFVKRKGLTADRLRLEIPITQPGCLEAILDGNVDENVQMTFVECLAERYAAPSNHTIRQRLRLARMVQDGYVRMLKFLCPGVDRQCTDPQNNKLLQLFNIYKLIYNLTVEAWRNCREQGADAENSWFEAHLPDWDKFGLFLSILPSCHDTANLEVAHLLTRLFYEMRPEGELEDHIGYDQQSFVSILKRNIERAEAALNEEQSKLRLIERMRKSSPWRAVQGEDRYWVISQVAPNPSLSFRAKTAAIQRLRELALTPAETIPAILIELSSYLNGERHNWSKDTRAKVQALLDEAESTEGYDLWRAALLQYKAKHLLACNDFVGAGKLFKEALEAAQERNYGPLRGEVARDCFAVELANQKLIVNNHEKYFREMLAGGMLEDNEQIPPIEEVARAVFGYFWDSLYKTYPGVPTERPRSLKIFEKMTASLIELFSDGDQVGWKEWIKANRQYLKSNLPDVEGNSVLMLLVKMRTGFRKRLPWLQQMTPPELSADLQRFETMLEHWRQFIKQLAEMVPIQLDIRDLKGQTPLMLAAEDGDTELVLAMLKAGADPDIQDWQGMTALHSAAKSHVKSCVDALLDHPCSLANITVDGRSPMHTASWSGNMHAVERLLQLAPELAWQRDGQEMTPLELVESLIDNPSELTAINNQRVQSGGRSVSKQELLNVARILEQATPVQQERGGN